MCTSISLQSLQRENFFGRTYGQNLGGIIETVITTAGAKYSEEDVKKVRTFFTFPNIFLVYPFQRRIEVYKPTLIF